MGVASGSGGYKRNVEGVLQLMLRGEGYQPGGAAFGGFAAMLMHSSLPLVCLGVELPRPPQPSLLDGSGVPQAAATARFLAALGWGGVVGSSALSPRFGHPTSALLNASHALGSQALMDDCAPAVQRRARAVLRFWGLLGSGGSEDAQGAGADALCEGVFAALSPDAAGGAVATRGNPFDAALFLGFASLGALAGARGARGAGSSGERGSVSGVVVARRRCLFLCCWCLQLFIARLSLHPALFHLYRTGCVPLLHVGARESLRGWVAKPHGDVPEGFALL